MKESLLRNGKRALHGIRQKPIVATLALYFIVTSVVTFPFVLHPRTTITAPVAGDAMSSAVLYGAFVREQSNPFFVDRADTIAQPDGIHNNIGVNRASFLSTLFLWISSYIFGPIGAHSFETFLGLFLTASVMYLFVRSITKSSAIACIAGLVYGFWPHMLSLARAAPTYTHMWLFILPLWAFWSLIVHGPTKKRIVLSAASVMPAVFWTPYFAFHVFLIGGGCLLVAFLLLRPKINTLKNLMLCASIAGVWVCVLATYYLLGMSSGNDDVPVRSIAEIYQQSASPLMYLLPGESTGWGKPLNEVLVQLVPRALQTNLYLGISTLCLAALSIYAFIRKKHIFQKEAQLQPVVLMAGAVAILCFLFSLPPTITLLGHSMTMPGYLIAEHVPALRAGQRLVMPLMGAVTVLAALGIYSIVRTHTGRAKYTILAGVALVLCIDLWSPYADATSRVQPTPAISKLQSLPDGRVAQYRVGSLVGYPGQAICGMQLYHQKPIINDCGIGRSATDPATPSTQLARVVKMPLCDQWQGLKKLNVRYVIIENDDRETMACFKPHVKEITKDGTYHLFTLNR